MAISSEELKAAYIKKYGYTVCVPGFEDVFKYKPNALKTKEEIKEEKRQNLSRVLASPSPDLYKNYASVMTWIDNIQDTASVVYPAAALAVKYLPRLAARAVPILGWAMLGYDLLQLANSFGRLKFKGRQAKRLTEKTLNGNPFSKSAQAKRMERVKNFKPSYADVIQAAQVTADTTGVGLSLGAVMGFIPDLLSGVYRKLNGEKVNFFTKPPKLSGEEMKSLYAIAAASKINTSGQTFDEDTHFLSHITFACATKIATPVIEQFDFMSACEPPFDAIIPADRPQDPLTIEVIKEAGLSIDEGVGWPHTGEKITSLGDFADHITAASMQSLQDFWFRHQYDMRGYFSAQLVSDGVQDMITATMPEMEFKTFDKPIVKAVKVMMQYPIIPGDGITEEQWRHFEEWVNAWSETYEQTPPAAEIKTKFELMGLPYKTTFPTEDDEEALRIFGGLTDDAELI